MDRHGWPLSVGGESGGRGVRLQSKLGLAIRVERLEALLEEDRLRQMLQCGNNEIPTTEQQNLSAI